MNRRKFVKMAGTALAGVVALVAMPKGAEKPVVNEEDALDMPLWAMPYYTVVEDGVVTVRSYSVHDDSWMKI